jgi:hypothetical protein
MRSSLLLLLLPLHLLAAELDPWFGDFLQPEVRAAYVGQYYPKVTSSSPQACPCLNSPNDLHSAWASTAITPWPYVNTELELAITHSAQTSKTFFDYGMLTARYKILDDISGDCLSLATGFSLAVPSDTSLREVGTPWMGRVQLEFHAAAGKEVARCWQAWDWRVWAFGGVAFSRFDWPRLRMMAFVERQIRCHRFKIGLRGLIGLAGEPLLDKCCFHGYAPIQTRAAEVEAGYCYTLPCVGSLFIDYRFRFLARNYPASTSIVRVGFYYPLSL